MNWLNDASDVRCHIEDDIRSNEMSTTKPKVKPLKTWVVKCHDGQHNDTWEIQAGDRQSAKDWAAQKHGTFSTYYLTAKLKK